MVGVCICYGIAGVFATIFFCIPISGFWNPSPTDKCISKQGLWLTHSAINIVTDVIIFLIPVWCPTSPRAYVDNISFALV